MAAPQKPCMPAMVCGQLHAGHQRIATLQACGQGGAGGTVVEALRCARCTDRHPCLPCGMCTHIPARLDWINARTASLVDARHTPPLLPVLN